MQEIMKPICPMRKSGGSCVKDGCAWWNENECAVLSIARLFCALNISNPGIVFYRDSLSDERR